MALGLTRQQSQTLRFIAGYLEAHGGIGPSVQNVMDGIGVSSNGHACHLLCGLEERGYIRRLPNRVRAIELLQPVAIPRAPDGAPLYLIPVPSPLSCTGSRRNAVQAVPPASIHDPLTSNPKGYAAGAVGVTDFHEQLNSAGSAHDHA